MGKIMKVEKSRKEHTCSKCRKVIEKGMPYLKGVINFSPDIVRCSSCGLEQWEVTTSEYQKEVGEIAYRWRENYAVDECTIDNIRDDLENVRDNEQDKLDNLPENLQSSPNADLIQERIDNLESTIDELDNIDLDSFKADVVSEQVEDEYLAELEFDVLMEKEDVPDDIKETLQEEYISKLEEAIDEALQNLNI